MNKILFIESGITGGGSFESLVGIVTLLSTKGWHPIVVFLNKTLHAERLDRQGIQTFILADRLYSLKGSKKMRESLARISIGLSTVNCHLHVAFLKYVHRPLIKNINDICENNNITLLYTNDQINRDFFGVLFSRMNGLPLVSHLRSMHGKGFCKLKAKMANETVINFVANSNATKKYWVSFGLHPNKVRVVPNAVPKPEESNIDPFKMFGFGSDTKIIGCVGRLIELKGHSFLIHAYAKMIKSVPDTILLIVGDGPLMGRLRKLTKHLGISDKVVFTGHREDARDMMGKMNLLVLPSKYESSGRVLLEAMSRKIPVIGTNRHGIKEIIDHGVNGFLTPFGQEDQMADYMKKIILDRTLAESMGKEGVFKVLRNHSVEKHVLVIESIIRESMLKNQNYDELGKNT